MLRINGTLTVNGGRLSADSLVIGENGTLENNAEVYTGTTVSEGEIVGTGTLWAHVASKPIGGLIDTLQKIIYYGDDRKYVLPITFGGLITIPKFRGEGGLT